MARPTNHEAPAVRWRLRIFCTVAMLAISAVGNTTTPLGTPDPDTIDYPDGELPSAREVQLGKQLFFDRRLSRDRDRSCASCHNPDLGFGDGLRQTLGSSGKPLARNTPPIYNLAWNTVFFWDGRARSLEEQALMPIAAQAEMNLPLPELLSRLQAVPHYRREFRAIYGSEPVAAEQIASALASFMRTIISNNAPFDRYRRGVKDAMSPAALRGLTLFEGKARCHRCHDGVNFTDESFHSLGLPDDDKGRGAVIDEASLNHTFKTPGLRNVALTYPYLHDGSLPDLESVIRFYNQGGGDAGHKDKLMVPLELGEAEIADLLAFLGALTSPVSLERPVVPE